MRFMNWLAALVAAGMLSIAPAAAQMTNALPSAATLTGTEQVAMSQGTGCATHVAPCISVKATLSTIATFTSASLDAKLVAIAGLSPSADTCFYFTSSTAVASYSCPSFGRSVVSAASASAARGTLGAAASGANGDITSLTGLTTALPLTEGGTGATTASAARTALAVTTTGADTTYAYRANNLSDVASAPTARTNLGLAIGTNVQAYNADLAAIVGLSPSNDDILQRKAGAWTNRTPAQYRVDLAASWVPCKSAVAASITGTLTETTLVTCTIPANAIGPNGQVEIATLWSSTNSANTKTLRVKFGGTAYYASPVTATLSANAVTRIANRNATNSQIGFQAIATAGIGNGGANANTTSAVDTTAAVNIDFTGQLTNTGETITLESYLVRVTYGA
jgi:hypothetical protein